MDISTLSLAELRELERLIPREIRRREVEEKAMVRKEVEAMVAARGYSLDDLIDASSTRGARAGLKVAVKYRHPQQRDLTWTGRGRKPHWVEAWVNEGGSLDQLVVS